LIAFGNQTISQPFGETHGFAPLPRGRFALIVCNRHLGKNSTAELPESISDPCIKYCLAKFVKDLSKN
jgi:hypothetical protein